MAIWQTIVASNGKRVDREFRQPAIFTLWLSSYFAACLLLMPSISHLRKKAARRRVLRSILRTLPYVLLTTYFIWYFNRHPVFTVVAVELQTAVQGQVTKCDVNRQHFNWFLDGKKICYDFWSFEPADSATRHLVTTDSLVFVAHDSSGRTHYNTLAYYLHVGARLRKEADSPYIMVKQNHRLTRWKYQTYGPTN